MYGLKSALLALLTLSVSVTTACTPMMHWRTKCLLVRQVPLLCLPRRPHLQPLLHRLRGRQMPSPALSGLRRLRDCRSPLKDQAARDQANKLTNGWTQSLQTWSISTPPKTKRH
jgi:hypothetical protein